MTWITGTAVSGTTPAGPALTVPVGVASGWTGLIIYARGDGTDWDPVPAKVGASFTLIDDRAATNLRVTVWAATSLVAGDVITSTATVNGLPNAWHVWTDELTYDVASLAAGIRGASSTITTSGSLTPALGQTVAVIGLERSTTTGTVVSSAVSTGGEALTQRLFSEETSTVTSAYVATFTASAAASRSVTLTHTTASTNGYAAVLTTTATAPAAIEGVIAKVEVEFVPQSGVYVDISSRVQSYDITHPRVRPGFGGAVTEFGASLLNDPIRPEEVGVLGGVTSAHVGFSPFTPENPAGAFYPGIEADRRIRVTAYWDGGSAVRFQGWIDVWAPTAGDNPPATAMVDITASCLLSRYARKSVLSVFGELAIVNSPDREYLPWDDGADATSLRVASTGDTGGRKAVMVQPTGRLPGSATLGSPDGGHLTDGQIDFTRGDENAPAPVVGFPLRPGTTLKGFQAWYRLTNDPAGSIIGDDCVTGFSADGDLMWVWGPRLIAGKIRWALTDRDGIARSFYDTGAPRDDGWHYWAVTLPSSTSSALYTADKGQSFNEVKAFGSLAWPYDPRNVTYLSIGGRMYPNRKGKQTNTYQGTIWSLLINYDAALLNVNQGNPAVVLEADQSTGQLIITTAVVDALAGPVTGNLVDPTPIMYTNATRDLLGRWNEHARTIGGALYTRPQGTRGFNRAKDMFPPAVSLTLDAEKDLSAPDGGWAPVKEERPTRVTVTAPSGTYEVVDDEREAAYGVALEGQSIESGAGSPGLARSLAGLQLGVSSSRLSSFGVDLTTSANDVTAAAMAMDPTDRIRIFGLNPAYQGVTYVDVFASGWRETYIAEDQSYRFVYDTDPAADYDPGRFDSTLSGRFAMGEGESTVTSGTAVGVTGPGTIVVTGVPINPAAVPLDLNWNGERVTVTAAGGGTSPQTLTISTRAVAPTVARVHVAGEPIEIYRPLRFGV